jgi:hypothetical protein
MNYSIPTFEQGDKVRFYYIDYNNKICNLFGINGILVEIYNKKSKTYWNLEYYPQNDRYFFGDKAGLVCYEANHEDNVENFKPIYYYRSSYDFTPNSKIVYKLSDSQADMINSYLANCSYPRYFKWFSSSNTNISNDWDFFGDIFNKLDIHINGTFADRLDTIA